MSLFLTGPLSKWREKAPPPFWEGLENMLKHSQAHTERYGPKMAAETTTIVSGRTGEDSEVRIGSDGVWDPEKWHASLYPNSGRTSPVEGLKKDPDSDRTSLVRRLIGDLGAAGRPAVLLVERPQHLDERFGARLVPLRPESAFAAPAAHLADMNPLELQQTAIEGFSFPHDLSMQVNAYQPGFSKVQMDKNRDGFRNREPAAFPVRGSCRPREFAVRGEQARLPPALGLLHAALPGQPLRQRPGVQVEVRREEDPHHGVPRPGGGHLPPPRPPGPPGPSRAHGTAGAPAAPGIGPEDAGAGHPPAAPSAVAPGG
ncbi:hypothetical protein JD844_015086 [Phrynosoma platyrhinos]|uniref:Uncharacterized protein n=1 Tax=Phrynosoma platyrhinos TaxID=52577 RepID=A0ABQ7T727_PHRPL|nr:hypothetical protein JD844_015086 [Phrynosoma platyrhinos]